MAYLDPITNLAKVTVSIGYDASATSIVLSAGHGARLPSTFSFNMTWWNSSDYSDPSDDPNVEIVRVTNRSTDTLTVTRGQEGITATTKNTGSKTYKMVLSMTKKTKDDIDTALSSSAGLAAAITDETGTGALVFGTAPTFTTSVLNNGFENIVGYLRVGSSSAPTNTTAGDITGTRLSIGNATLSAANGQVVTVSGAAATNTSGTDVMIGATNILSPATDSTGGNRVFSMTNRVNALGVAFTGVAGNAPSSGYFENRVFDALTINQLNGIQAIGIVAAGTLAASGLTTVEVATAGLFQAVTSFTNTNAATINRAIGIQVTDSVKNTFTITNTAHFVAAVASSGTNNAYIVIGNGLSSSRPVLPTGNWGIYNASTNANYINGTIQLGTTTLPTSATFNVVLGGGATTPVLGAATADIVSVAAVDNGAGNRELQVQPEAGGILGYGNGILRTPAGASTGFAKHGGAIFNSFTDTSVGGAEADIYTNTTAASTLGTNADKITAVYGGNFVTVGTELTQLKVYFAGTAIWDSTGVAPTTGTTSWRVNVEIIRVSSTVVRYTVSLNTTGASGYVYCTAGELTGLTLSNTNILKITGTSTGVGSGAGDIVGKMAQVRWEAAA